MELRLKTDSLLTAFFNEYLQLEVFGVKVSYIDGCVSESSHVTGRQDQDALLAWCEEQRWTFFIKSRLYTEYKLCSHLFTAVPAVSPWSPSSVAASTSDKESKMYREFKRWTDYLRGTHGQVLVQLWTQLEAWQMDRDWKELRSIREHCSYVPGLVKYSCGGPVETGAWVEALKTECKDRLMQYWLPRIRHGAKRHHVISDNLSCDLNDTFESGLRCNQRGGRPFEDFLTRCVNESHICCVRAWEALDNFLLTQQSRGDQFVIREGWRLWSEYIDTQDGDCCVTSDNKALLLRSLSDFSRISVVKTLSLIQNDLLSTLKRVWTQFLRHDHQTFLQCIQAPPLLPGNDNSAHHMHTHKSRKLNKSKRDKELECLTFDLKGTPLEPLEDFETLLSFEQFLFTKCGPKSQANINYLLWKSLMKLSITTERKKRDSLAMHIHRTYLFSEAKRCLLLPDSLLEQVDTGSEVTQPTSPVLKSLAEFSSRYLETIVTKFLGEDDEVVDLLPRLDSPKKTRRSKTSSSMRARTEAQHLLFMLGRCEGPLSRQLHAFSEHLEHQCPPTQHRQLTNNVKFWLEVHKFKAMFINETNIRVLYHKGEAIVDRYLDTTSLPWVKVTVPGDLAVQIVSAVNDLRKVEVLAHLERLYQLLERAQELTFADMAPYWGTFCAQYVSPSGSTLSIPHAVEPSLPSSRKPSLHLPPITHTTIHTPLLSFSSLKGLKWKASLQNPQT